MLYPICCVLLRVGIITSVTNKPDGEADYVPGKERLARRVIELSRCAKGRSDRSVNEFAARCETNKAASTQVSPTENIERHQLGHTLERRHQVQHARVRDGVSFREG